MPVKRDHHWLKFYENTNFSEFISFLISIMIFIIAPIWWTKKENVTYSEFGPGVTVGHSVVGRSRNQASSHRLAAECLDLLRLRPPATPSSKVSQWSFICATGNMWHNTLPAITFLVLAATAVQVEDDSQGFVDEDSDAVVIEG